MIVDEPARRGGAVAAAMEERSVPFHLAGPAALFRRPEVRDAIAWLRVLADPDDSAAAARALTRPPIELRSVDLARLTTIARRRKLDMVSACEAALESPQIQPEARERIQGFLKLYRRRLGGDRGAPRRRLRAAADRAGRPAPPAPLRRPARGGRAAAQPLAAGRAGHGLDPPRAAGLDPRLRPLPERGRRRRGRAGQRGRAAGAGLGPGDRAGRRQGARVRPRLRARPGARRRAPSAPGPPPVPPELLGRGRRPRPARPRCDGPAPPRPAHRDDPGPRRPRALLGRARPRGRHPALAVLRGGAHGARGQRGDPRGGAVRPGRGPARDLPDAARRGPRGAPGRRGASCPSRAWTPRSTSTARSPATSSC